MAAPVGGKTVAPYGRWGSRISPEDATAGSRILSSPRACPRSGRAFFLESKANGSNAIVEVALDAHAAGDGGAKKLRYVLPEPYGCDTNIYEYGGLPYAVLPASGGGGDGDSSSGDGKGKEGLRIIFSDGLGQSCNLLDVDAGTVTTIVRSPTLRYADFDPDPTPGSRWVLCVEEDHEKPRPDEVRNYVSAVDVRTGEVRRVRDTADFYSYPRLSPDGTKLCWREWDHPGLPFLGVKLCWGDWNPERGSVENVELVAGEGGQSVGELHWAPDGTLFYTQELAGSNFRQLCTIRPGDADGGRHFRLEGLENVEFGDASWYCGFQTFVFLSKTSLLAVYTENGTSYLSNIDIPSRSWKPLDVGLHDMRLDPLSSLSETSFLIRGSGHTTPLALYRVDLAPSQKPEVTLLHSSTSRTHPPSIFSTPEHIEIQSRGEPKRPIHGFFWPPHNPDFVAPEGSLPPLIVQPHGGPTGHITPGLDIAGVQFWTSRGFAVLGINYTGSSGGHGRDYRERLFHGAWGVLDRDDVPEFVHHLSIVAGRVDPARVGIEGGSAGGYNVLQSLVWHPDVFAGGICYCGVSDVKALDRDTHKLESRYMGLLLFEPGMTDADKEARFRERSPLFHAQRITAPLLLVHGDADTVVPIAQSEEIRDRVLERGGDVKLVVLPGDGHIFKKEENLRLFLDEQVKWWEKTLLN